MCGRGWMVGRWTKLGSWESNIWSHINRFIFLYNGQLILGLAASCGKNHIAYWPNCILTRTRSCYCSFILVLPWYVCMCIERVNASKKAQTHNPPSLSKDYTTRLASGGKSKENKKLPKGDEENFCYILTECMFVFTRFSGFIEAICRQYSETIRIKWPGKYVTSGYGTGPLLTYKTHSLMHADCKRFLYDIMSGVSHGTSIWILETNINFPENLLLCVWLANTYRPIYNILFRI